MLKAEGTLWIGDCYNAATNAPQRPSASRVGSWRLAGSMGDRRIRAEGLKPKDLIGVPWRVALALQADGWYLRSDVIWSKPNPIPEGVRDRPVRSHEYVFLLAKQSVYFYDAEAVRESATGESGLGDLYTAGALRRGRAQRSVWSLPTQRYHQAHFATFPSAWSSRASSPAPARPGCCSRVVRSCARFYGPVVRIQLLDGSTA